jgi:diacylglycerol kinase family enzyme
VIATNLRAGIGEGAKSVELLVNELAQRGLVSHVLTDLDQVRSVTSELHQQGRLLAVVAAGGDGTAEAVVNRVPHSTPIAVLPLGTENLLAKFLGLTADPSRLADIICEGHSLPLDAGKVQWENGEEGHFLLMLGVGFDADVIHRLHALRCGPITHWAYAKPIWDAMRTYNYPSLHIRYLDAAGQVVRGPLVAHWAFVFNIPTYAVGLPICSDADPTDGQLDVTTFYGGSVGHGLWHLASVMIGRHRGQPCVRVDRVAGVRIESEQPVPVQMDGDPAGALPIEVRAIRNHWRVLVSATAPLLATYATRPATR